MKTLVESIFGDNITNDVSINLNVIKVRLINELKKKHFEVIDWDKFYSAEYEPKKPFISIEDDIEKEDYFHVSLHVPVGYKKAEGVSSNIKEVYIGVDFCISLGKYLNEFYDKCYIERADLQCILLRENNNFWPYAKLLWDDMSWKSRTNLKTIIFSESSFNDITKYIFKLFDKLIKITKRDKNETCKWEGSKDSYFYLDKLINELT